MAMHSIEAELSEISVGFRIDIHLTGLPLTIGSDTKATEKLYFRSIKDPVNTHFSRIK